MTLTALTYTTLAVAVACTAALALVPAVPTLALVPLLTLSSATLRPLLAARLNELIPSAQRATILSLSSLVFTLALAAGEPAILAFADVSGPAAALGASALAFALVVVPLAALWDRAERGEVVAPEPEPVPAEPVAR